VRALSMIVHEGADVEKALDFLNHPEKTDSENEPLGLKLAKVS